MLHRPIEPTLLSDISENAVSFSYRLAYLFYRTAKSTLRKEALHKCFPLYEETTTAAMVNAASRPTHFAESGREVATACMRSQGWNTVPPE